MSLSAEQIGNARRNLKRRILGKLGQTRVDQLCDLALEGLRRRPATPPATKALEQKVVKWSMLFHDLALGLRPDIADLRIDNAAKKMRLAVEALKSARKETK